MNLRVRLGLTLALVSAAACSHTRPYFPHPSFQPVAESSIDDSALRARVILVGDAGEPDAPTLPAVGAWARRSPELTLVAFLGDNMYPEGLTPQRQNQASTRLLPLIETASEAGAHVLFIPGNHDWADGDRGGFEAILAQADYVRSRVGIDESFLPSNGCPGPVTLDVLPEVRIVALDTQWWLHDWDKPTTECPNSDAEAFRQALRTALDTDRDVVIAAHHPLDGHGRHSGFSSLRDHLLPPVVGSAIALWRKLAPRPQDYGSQPYRSMTDLYRSALERPSEEGALRIWASGHEHSLEIMESDGVDYLLVSGSGAKTTALGDGPNTLFALSRHGFMVLDFLRPDSVLLRVVELDRMHAFRLKN